MIELLVTIAVVAIMATWAVPGFSQLSARNVLDRQADRLWQAISAMRLEAAERRAEVHLCPTNDDTTCTDDWQNSWMLFVDADSDGVPDSGETLIRHYPGNAGPIHISTNSSNQANGFSYQPTGFTTARGTFDLCHPDLDSGNARQIVISFGQAHRTRDNSDSC